MISGQTANVGPGQKAFSNASGDLVQAIASPTDYPQWDPEAEQNIESELENIINSQKIDAQQQNSPPELEPEPTIEDTPESEPESFIEDNTESIIKEDVDENTKSLGIETKTLIFFQTTFHGTRNWILNN